MSALRARAGDRASESTRAILHLVCPQMDGSDWKASASLHGAVDLHPKLEPRYLDETSSSARREIRSLLV
jgi:hypothetical protein